jgi:peptidoglycan lytic transglycosylase
MVGAKKPRNLSPARPQWFWVVAGILSLATAAVVFTDSTLTVQADTPLARPAATLPPAAPPASFLTERKAAVKQLFPAEALHGIATWYGAVRQGHRTASGERFDEMAMTAAHKSLPFGTLLRVVNLKTNKSVVVRINDRGQLPADHVIDLSYAAAEELGIVRTGIAPVRLDVISLGHSRLPTAEPAN